MFIPLDKIFILTMSQKLRVQWEKNIDVWMLNKRQFQANLLL